jgi:GLPGLI family protein
MLTALLLASSGLVAQGLYYESTMTGGPFGNDGNVSHTYLMPKMMKYVNAKDGDFMIMRMDTEKMISVDVTKKTYWETSFAELEQSMKKASAKMDAQMEKMKEQMKDMPEEQRKMMEKMFGGKTGGPGAAVTMTKTGETKKISGFSCTKFVAKEGDKELMTIWATKDVKTFDVIRKDYESLTKRMTAMNPTFAKGLVEAMYKIDGFPIQTVWGEFLTTVTKVESRTTPASEFNVPAGYAKEDPPMKKMGGKGDEE